MLQFQHQLLIAAAQGHPLYRPQEDPHAHHRHELLAILAAERRARRQQRLARLRQVLHRLADLFRHAGQVL